jgi:hypothetical protein
MLLHDSYLLVIVSQCRQAVRCKDRTPTLEDLHPVSHVKRPLLKVWIHVKQVCSIALDTSVTVVDVRVPATRFLSEPGWSSLSDWAASNVAAQHALWWIGGAYASRKRH